MPTDFEQLLKDVFGESINRLNTFQSDQMKRLQSKLQEMAREAIKEDLARLQGEITDLRARLVTLEAERAQTAADSIGSSF
jgi:polyhydroxyalkanoate synthesis regulator phasin